MKKKKRQMSIAILSVVADSITVLISWFLAYYLRFYVLPGAQRNLFDRFSQLSLLVLVLYLYFFNRNHMYDDDYERSWRKDVGRIFYSSIQVFLMLVLIFYFLFPQKVSRISLALHFCFSLVFLIVERTILSSYISQAYRRGKYTRRLLLVGFGHKLEAYEKSVKAKMGEGIILVGQYDGENRPIEACPVVAAPSLAAAVRQSRAEMVVIAYPGPEFERQEAMVAESLDLLKQKVILLPSLPESYIGTKIADFNWVPLLYLNASEIGIVPRMAKRTFDFFSSLLAIIILSPVLLVIAILIKVTSPGPVVFKQKRVTRGEEIFTMYKFRSMRTDMSEGKAHWTVQDDPRVTAIGRFLRRTSLDELPQLFNVLEGSMSLIGPRPERPELVGRFNSEIPGYRMRHRVKAGISGWAQVNGWRGNTSLERRIEFDLFYIRNWSLLFDLKIIFFTFFRGFVNENAY